MEIWFIILLSLSIAALIKALINLLYPTKKINHKLPPGPFTLPIVGNFLLLHKSQLELQCFIRTLRSKLGPMVTLYMTSSPTIFISDRSLVHQVLIQNGAIFADRPPATAIRRVTSGNQHTISSAAYGPTWRLLRRNLMTEVLHPSSVKSYSHERRWVLQTLLDCFKSHSKSGDPLRLIGHFQYAMCCLLVSMCFGDKLDHEKIKQIEDVQRRMQLSIRRFNVLNFWPRVTKIVFRKRYDEFLEIRKQQEAVFMPLIRERRKLKADRLSKAKQDHKDVKDHDYVLAYIDTLFDLQLPNEKRNLDENEIMSLCMEFLNAGIETTTSALQWVMANLVKYPNIQEKLFREIKGVVGDADGEVNEDNLQKMPYLKAVILESLRRHPPARFVAPHAVTEDIVLNGFLLPKNAAVNILVADMGWESKVWDDPMAFKPERFLNSENGEVFDITGSREIKMMPFGVGRRICPALRLAMLHLEYFVANFIWCYEWKAVDEEISLEETVEFLAVMKTPLQAYASPRFK